jgi:hypothetical protein
MAILKNIAKLSDKDTKTREAQFEAEMLAMAAQGTPPKPTASPRAPAAAAPTPQAATSPASPDLIWPPLEATTSPTPPATISPVALAPAVDGIQILVTNDGQTARYDNLLAVPGPIRQHIMSTWIGSPTSTIPPVLNAPSLRNDTLPSPAKRRPKTMKLAMFLNLIVPGAGQFYLGQRLAGAIYALAFLASFAAALSIFVHGYYNYLSLTTSGDVLDPGNLEQISHAFPAGIISALSAIGIVIYLASTIHLAVSRARKQV